MKKTNVGISNMYAVIGMIALLVVGLAGGYLLRAPPEPGDTDEYSEDSVWRSQTINIAGSTTVLPIAETAADEFMQEHSGVTITVQGGGSGQGYSQIISGVIDIGDASRPPKDQEISNAAEQGKELWIHPIALDAVCVVVNPSVLEGTGLDSLELTLEEVGKIYTGEYTNWNQLKSSLPGEEIYVVVRESGSGTRGTFEEYTMDDFGLTVDSSVVHEEPSNPAVRTTVEGTDYSIGYVGFGFLSDNMVAVDLAIEEGEEYVHPSLESIGGGQYPISRLLYFVTSEPTPESGSLADRFIDFVLSEEGQDIVESEDYLRLPAEHNCP